MIIALPRGKNRAIVICISLFFASLWLFLGGCSYTRKSGPSALPAFHPILEERAGEESVPKKSRQVISPEDKEILKEEDAWWEEEGEEEEIAVADPLYYWNKAMFHFNDKLYFWLLKPVAQGYRYVVPETARIGVKNFFYNIGFPVRFTGSLLQAKGKDALNELFRFCLNTTMGFLGFMDPASDFPELNPTKEDLGQAFGRWGIGKGPYIVWPFLGPSTLRDSVGLVGEFFLDPVTYVEPVEAVLAIDAGKAVNHTSLTIGDYEALKKAALDPYAALRDAYVQDREKAVAD